MSRLLLSGDSSDDRRDEPADELGDDGASGLLLLHALEECWCWWRCWLQRWQLTHA